MKGRENLIELRKLLTEHIAILEKIEDTGVIQGYLLSAESKTLDMIFRNISDEEFSAISMRKNYYSKIGYIDTRAIQLAVCDVLHFRISEPDTSLYFPELIKD